MSEIIQKIFDDSAFQFALAMAALQTFADYNLKRYAQDDEPINIMGGTAGYAAIVYILQRALRNNKLYRVNNYWNAMTSITYTMLGVSMGEAITNTQILGVILIIVGVLLI